MNEQQKREIIFNKVWQACDTFRGVIDPAQYKDYILTMLFVKYLSDIHQSKRVAYEKKYKGDLLRVERALSRERFVIPNIEIRDRHDKLEDVFSDIFKDYEHGLNLIRGAQGVQKFEVTEDVIRNPRAALDEWIRSYYVSRQ